MLLLNLVPANRRPSLDSLDQHPYFVDLLTISGPGGNPLLARVCGSDFANQATFLDLVAQAYAPISMAAPLAFRRVAELSKHAEPARIARRIYDIEMGREPLVQGSPVVPHLEQFRRMMESLLTGLCIDFPGADAYPVHAFLDLNNAPLTEALVMCEEIETAGKGMIEAIQDFVAQWQTFQGLRSARVDRAFLDEHGLVEGGKGDAQRLGMLEKMMAPYESLRLAPGYAQARERARRELSKHLDQSLETILERCTN